MTLVTPEEGTETKRLFYKKWDNEYNEGKVLKS